MVANSGLETTSSRRASSTGRKKSPAPIALRGAGVRCQFEPRMGAASYSLGREPQEFRRETNALLPEPLGRPVGPAKGLGKGERNRPYIRPGAHAPGFTISPHPGLGKPGFAWSKLRIDFRPRDSPVAPLRSHLRLGSRPDYDRRSPEGEVTQGVKKRSVSLMVRRSLFARRVPFGRNVAAVVAAGEHGDQNDNNRNLAHVSASMVGNVSGRMNLSR